MTTYTTYTIYKLYLSITIIFMFISFLTIQYIYYILVLLDLPVQTSSEVMGFGHGSPSSAHHLPFRFYDQSRQGVSDPTVQRSVFASVDKVPGNVE